MTDKDSAVIQSVLDGNVEAFRHLVARHQGRLFTILLRVVGDEQEAEDLAQATFVKAYRSLSSFRGDSSFGTWLVQIGIHASRDCLRRRMRERERGTVSLESVIDRGGDAAEPADPGTTDDAKPEIERREDEALLQDALAELPPEYRLVLVLKHLEEWPFTRIAEFTGDSVGTLKVRAHRARRMLRERLAAIGPEDGNRETENDHE